MQLLPDLRQIDNQDFTPDASPLDWWGFGPVAMSRSEPVSNADFEGLNAVDVNAARPQSRRVTRVARFVTAVLAMVYVAAAGVSHAAGRVFSDGFESGNTGQWQSDGSRQMCTVVGSALDGGASHSGKFMLECNWDGTLPWTDNAWYSTVMLPQTSWNYSQEFLIRLWIRYDADVTHADGGKVLRLYPHDDLDSFFVGAQMNHPGGPIFVSWEKINGRDSSVSWGGGTQFGDTRWHKLEIYVKHNSVGASDGVGRVWLDGKVVQEIVNVVTIAPGHQWGPLYLMSNWTNNPGWAHGASNHVYWDDVEIFSDVGSGGSGLMSDATITGGLPAPNPPRSVSVQ